MSLLRASQLPPEITLESLDTLRRSANLDDSEVAEWFRHRVEERSFDLVITTDNAALDFVDRHYRDFFDDVPIVFSDAHNVDLERLRTRFSVTGIAENTDYEGTFELANQIRPKAKKIIVFGNHADSGAGPRLVEESIFSYSFGLPIELYEDLSLEEVIAKSATLDPEDIIFSLASAISANGVWNSWDEVQEAIGRVSPAPNFTFWNPPAEGTLGGKVYGPEDQGRAAAELALRILAGEDANQIPILNGVASHYVFDYRQLKRHQVPLSLLPKGSRILNRPILFWEEYREITISILSAMAVLCAIIVLLLQAIRRRKRAERELAAHQQQLENLVQERTEALVASNRSLSGTLEHLKATQNHLIESRKMAALGGLVSGVAHEINTPLGVALTAACLLNDKTTELRVSHDSQAMTEEMFADYVGGSSKIADMILTNLGLAVDLIQNFKHVAVDQTTAARRRIKLRSYLNATIESLQPKLRGGSHRVEVNCPKGIRFDTYPGAISQILNNLVTNSLFHGFSDERIGGKISIDVALHDADVWIIYRDNGAGMEAEVLDNAFKPFFTTARGRGGSGLGLHIVYNLVTHKLGGGIGCESSPGGGVRFEIVIPTQAGAESESDPPPHSRGQPADSSEVHSIRSLS